MTIALARPLFVAFFLASFAAHAALAANGVHADKAVAALCTPCNGYECSYTNIPNSASSRSVSTICYTEKCTLKVRVSSAGNFTAYVTDSVGQNSWYNGDKFLYYASLSAENSTNCFSSTPVFVPNGKAALIIYCKSSAGCNVAYSMELQEIDTCPTLSCPTLRCPSPAFTVETTSDLCIIVVGVLAVGLIVVALAAGLAFGAGMTPGLLRKTRQPAEIEMGIVN